MENKINISELLKDCPVGMELDCLLIDGLVFDRVERLDGKIRCYAKGDYESGCTHYPFYFYPDGRYLANTSAKCVIFPKGKFSWEGFHRPFKEGDVIVDKQGSIAIYKQVHKSYEEPCVDFHCRIYQGNNNLFHTNFIKGSLCHCGEVDSARFATEEEKTKLFKAIKDNGYKWNAEKKCLEKLPKFKDGDVIYNRDIDAIAIYHKQNDDETVSHCYLNTLGRLWFNHSHSKNLSYWEFATEKEKIKLLRAINDNGYIWNVETKTLEKLVKPKFKVGDRIQYKDYDYTPSVTIKSVLADRYILNDGTYIEFCAQDNYILLKFDINTLKPFTQVLVRNYNDEKWGIDFFGYYNKGLYYTAGNRLFKQCVPYKRNKHLLGTTNDCKEYYKNWED